ASQGISGVTLTLTGSQSASVTTDTNGDYFFTLPAGGTYTVTPTKTGLSFIPSNRTFNNLSANQTSNFAGTMNCVAPPPQMVAWYPADGNALDIQGGNNGGLRGNVTFASGEVGQSFQFDGATG